MVRMQVHFTDQQHEELKELAAREGVSVSEIVRRAVDDLLARESLEETDRWNRALSVVGAFRSDLSDVSERHDDYLADAYEGNS